MKNRCLPIRENQVILIIARVLPEFGFPFFFFLARAPRCNSRRIRSNEQFYVFVVIFVRKTAKKRQKESVLAVGSEFRELVPSGFFPGHHPRAGGGGQDIERLARHRTRGCLCGGGGGAWLRREDVRAAHAIALSGGH